MDFSDYRSPNRHRHRGPRSSCFCSCPFWFYVAIACFLIRLSKNKTKRYQCSIPNICTVKCENCNGNENWWWLFRNWTIQTLGEPTMNVVYTQLYSWLRKCFDRWEFGIVRFVTHKKWTRTQTKLTTTSNRNKQISTTMAKVRIIFRVERVCS